MKDSTTLVVVGVAGLAAVGLGIYFLTKSSSSTAAALPPATATPNVAPIVNTTNAAALSNLTLRR